MEHNYKKLFSKEIKRDGNSIGWFLFISAITSTNFILFMMELGNTFLGNNFADNTVFNLFALFAQCLYSLYMFFICGVIYSKISNTNLNQVITFKKNSTFDLLLLISLGYGTTFIASILSVLFDVNLSLFGLDTNIDTTFDTTHIFTKLLYILAVSIIPALIEEFVFRGIILGKLKKYGDAFAVLVSAILFGIMHGNLQQIPFAFIVGLILGFITVKSHSLLPAMIVHFLNNFISVIIDIITTNKLMSESLLEIFYTSLMIIAIICSFISAIKLSKRGNFFKLSNPPDILLFREKIKAFFTSVGSIVFIIYISYECIRLLKIGAK